MATERETGIALANAGANEIIDICNELAKLGGATTAVTALQGAVAAVLNAYQIQSEVFIQRVDMSRTRQLDAEEDLKRG